MKLWVLFSVLKNPGIRVNSALNPSGERFQKDQVLLSRFTGFMKADSCKKQTNKQTNVFRIIRICVDGALINYFADLTMLITRNPPWVRLSAVIESVSN